MPADLRRFLSLLEERGELVRVTDRVSPDLEITALADRAVKRGGPALLFENVEGSDLPLVIGLYGTRQRMAWALGLDDLDELTTRLRELIDVRVGGGLMGLASRTCRSCASWRRCRPGACARHRSRRSCGAATRSTSASCPCSPAGRRTAVPSSRCRW
jgi:3-polyprenyl-4-hydroxybenzoate decarboxylase